MSVQADILRYLLSVSPRTDEQALVDIKTYINSSDDITFAQLRKRMTEAARPYDYAAIRDDISKKYGIDIDQKTIKMMMEVAKFWA